MLEKNKLSKSDENQFTTIKGIADVYEVSADTVSRAVKKLFPEKMQNGKTTYLNEFEATKIKEAIFKNKYLATTNPNSLRRSAEVTTELEEMVIIAKGYEVLQRKLNREKELRLKIENEKKALVSKVIEDKPKVDGYNQLLSAKNAITMNETAKAIGVGRTKLFAFLREQNVLMHNNLPYQRFIDAGYFTTREFLITHYNGKIETKLQTLVYQKGVDYIFRQVNKESSALIFKKAV